MAARAPIDHSDEATGPPSAGRPARPAPKESGEYRIGLHSDRAAERRGATTYGILPPALSVPAEGYSRPSSGLEGAEEIAFRAPSPKSAVAAFAGYPETPCWLWETPGYAANVLLRQRTLRTELARARMQASTDRVLYEAALLAYDKTAVRKGIGLLLASLTLGLAFVGAVLASL